jgi:flagellar motility protein MotE (MotC chaperone)
MRKSWSWEPLIWVLAMGGVFAGTMVTGVAGNEEGKHDEPKHTQPKADLKTDAKKSGCLVDEASIEDLKKTREEMSVRKGELDSREADLKLKEQAVAEELKKLEQARDSISKIQAVKKKENEEKVAKLVETILNMSPKAASKLLSTLDDDLSISVMAQLETQRLAKILNLMDPARSSHLSELMVGVAQTKSTSRPARSLATSRDVAVATKSNEKGGEKNNGNNKQSSSGEFKQPQGHPSAVIGKVEGSK